MRIAIVNDLIIAVEALRRILANVPEYDLAWIAYDGVEAVAKCAEDTPDLILMDVLMPNMDGVEATQHIMNQSPCAILMVTASVNRYAAKVFAAMGYGALDAVNTPAMGLGEQTESSIRLLKKIATIARLIGKSSQQRSQFDSLLKPQNSPQQHPPLILIGSSTGGPQALVTILTI
jgi:two-component system, chemotaxis family, response regulator WspF